MPSSRTGTRYGICYTLATRCPVLTSPTLLPGCEGYAQLGYSVLRIPYTMSGTGAAITMPGTDVAYAATRRYPISGTDIDYNARGTSIVYGPTRNVLRIRRRQRPVLTWDVTSRPAYLLLAIRFVLRISRAISGTEIGYAATRFRLIKLCGVYYFIIVPLRAAFLPWYARPTRCPVLAWT
eukprot:1898679-Rhodomonas_salina.4